MQRDDRRKNWRPEFENVIDLIRRNPHEWGVSDCLLGLAEPVINAVRKDARKFKKYKGRYKTARGALGVMRRSGFKNLADLVASELEEIHPSETMMGDIVAIPTDDDFGFALGVVNDSRVFVMLANGLGTRDLSEATRAFKV